MIPDGELLRRYTETNSESAFTELVERHLALPEEAR
jgi:4-hydroxyphenylpyruvate dioxygenase-like putative hemolysin